MNTDDLGPRGRALWEAICAEHELTAAQIVQLEDACHATDEVERMTLMLIQGHDSKLQSDLNATRNLVKQLLAALRLPDEHGRIPQYRGARGAQRPTIAGGKVASISRAQSRTA